MEAMSEKNEELAAFANVNLDSAEEESSVTRSFSASTYSESHRFKGLDILLSSNRFALQRQQDTLESWYSPNVYKIASEVGSFGSPLFYAKEDGGSSLFKSLFCCNQRKAKIKITDTDDQVVIWLEHPFNCNFPVCCPSCRPSLIVRTSSGHILGYVEHSPRETCSAWMSPSQYYSIMNKSGKELLRIDGPVCKFELTKPALFRIYSPKYNAYVGEITHQWQGPCDGLCSCFFTAQPDASTIVFPNELGTTEKALLLASLFLTHLNYFEQV